MRRRVANQRAGDPDRHARRAEDERAAHHHPEDGRSARAERHAQADLVRPLRDRIRQHAVGADQREQQQPAAANAPSSLAWKRGSAVAGRQTSSISPIDVAG